MREMTSPGGAEEQARSGRAMLRGPRSLSGRRASRPEVGCVVLALERGIGGSAAPDGRRGSCLTAASAASERSEAQSAGRRVRCHATKDWVTTTAISNQVTATRGRRCSGDVPEASHRFGAFGFNTEVLLVVPRTVTSFLPPPILRTCALTGPPFRMVAMRTSCESRLPHVSTALESGVTEEDVTRGRSIGKCG